MDLKGSLQDTKLKIHPTPKLLAYLKTIDSNEKLTINIKCVTKANKCKTLKDYDEVKKPDIHLSDKEVSILNIIKQKTQTISDVNEQKTEQADKKSINKKDTAQESNKCDEKKAKQSEKSQLNGDENIKDEPCLFVSDIDWLYMYLEKSREEARDVPYLHDLLEGVRIETPENEILKRNPVLEARCVKLRAQQEAREYRQMTKGVDNVRMRYPEDSISYQMKHINRQLIAIGQFIISIFAGFLFGFRGVEWMVGNLDFGVRLLLGVMCALIIALAEIYFLAKKLNEEMNIPETVQLGGPPKFSENELNIRNGIVPDKLHQD